jgi:two-component system chemotaxis response regulator CheY
MTAAPFPGAVSIGASSQTAAAGGSLAGLKVLLIDDDLSFRPLVFTMLRRMGVAEIREARIGSEGRAMAMAEWFALIVCDWRLPDGVSGLDILKAVRAAKMSVPFLMMTGLVETEAVLAAKEAGVSGYIGKPFSAKGLEAKMRAMLKPPAPLTAPAPAATANKPTSTGPIKPSDFLRPR